MNRDTIKFFLIMIFWMHHLIAAPHITAITPSNGSFSGGNMVSISGSGFLGTTGVTFGQRPANTFMVVSDTTINVIVPAGTAGTVDVRVSVGTEMSVIVRNDLYTYTQDAWQGIISGINQDAITLFDTATNTISNVISLPSDSLSAIITPDGTTIYAADSDQALVNVIDLATNTIITNISTPVAGPGAFDCIVSPDGTKVYISNNLSGYVTVIDTTTNSVIADILTAPNLGSLSITPNGKTVYVDSFTYGGIVPIDTATNTVGTVILTGAVPGMIAITPDGTTAYVANSGSDTVSIVDVASNTVINTIIFPAGSGPYGSFIIPNGQTMYVANINNSTVSVVNLSNNMIVDTIPFIPGSRPFWAIATPDSKKVYVANQTTNDVTPIDVATNTAGTSFAALMGQIQDIVMSPDPAPVAAFSTVLQPAGTPSIFNASASLSPIGTITTYAWDFGDGNMLTTNSPITQHTYASSNSFTVTLTVTNSAGTSTTQVFSSRFMSNNGGATATVSQTFPSAPIDVIGCQKCYRYPTQTDIVNIITWHAPNSGALPVAYRIYRDANLTDLAATIPAGAPLIFEDHNRRPNQIYTYYLVSVSADGTISAPVIIVI